MKNPANKSKVSIGAKLLAFFFTLITGALFVAYETMKNNGNESNAASFINLINQKQKKYWSEHQGIYASDFSELDLNLSGKTVAFDGYIFTLIALPPTGTTPAFYSIKADPQTVYYFKTGTRRFYFDSTLATTKSTEETRPATAKDPTI